MQGGNRLRQSFLENERGSLFSNWIGEHKKVLDLGGRDGALTKYFTNNNTVTIGDIDKEALQYEKQTYNVETKIINLNETTILDDSFDIVVMEEVLEHLPYPEITLSEIKRILNKNGEFVGNVPLAYHLKDRYQILRGKKLVIAGDPTHLQFLTYEDALNLLSEYFNIQNIVILKGGKKADHFPKLFARNIAFKCSVNYT
ncbi:MAG TPA: class I SAM-dependent methyltransferase [Leucothrix sp.]|nr:class I SAM-dependent methyltransferase [Leucothrix sp.]